MIYDLQWKLKTNLLWLDRQARLLKMQHSVCTQFKVSVYWSYDIWPLTVSGSTKSTLFQLSNPRHSLQSSLSQECFVCGLHSRFICVWSSVEVVLYVDFSKGFFCVWFQEKGPVLCGLQQRLIGVWSSTEVNLCVVFSQGQSVGGLLKRFF